MGVDRALKSDMWRDMARDPHLDRRGGLNDSIIDIRSKVVVYLHEVISQRFLVLDDATRLFGSANDLAAWPNRRGSIHERAGGVDCRAKHSSFLDALAKLHHFSPAGHVANSSNSAC